MAVLEVLNVSAIAPFLALASDPALIEQNAVLSFFYETFGFASVNRFLVAVGVGVFTLMLLSNAWSALTIWAQMRLIWSWNHQLSVRLLQRYLYQPYSYFLSRNTAELSKNLLSEVHRVTGSMISPVILALGRIVVTVGIVAVLIVMNPVLALLVTVVVGGSYAAVYAFTRRRLNAIGGDLVKANEERFRVANEAFGGIKDVKVLNVEDAFLQRFTGSSRRFSRHEVTYAVIGALPRYAIETIAFGTVILIVVFLLAVERDFGSIVPMLGLYAFAGYRLMPSLQQVFAGITAARFYSSALEAVLNDLEIDEGSELNSLARSSASGPFERLTAAQARPSSEARTNASPVGLKEKLELKEVVFSYPNTGKPAVDNVSMTIPANSTVGFVGATGSGKTTLADVILGLLRPQSGEILVDGAKITDVNVSAWQASIGYVPQHIFLTDASVAENIAFGVPRDEIDMDAVRAAASIAQIDDFVMNELPRGYDTVVGERGIRLSGGQRQRIGIARALYRDPDVIVFDEATSALDNATEANVMKAVRRLLGTKTIIMVAHRITTLADCDVIYLFDKGRLVAHGSYGEYVANKGRFEGWGSSAYAGARHQLSGGHDHGVSSPS